MRLYWKPGPISGRLPICTWRGAISTGAGSTHPFWNQWARAIGAPYKNVLTHGFVVDGEGKKMSKSVGNVIDSRRLLISIGAEILRLWVAAEDYTVDIRISDEILKRLGGSLSPNSHTSRYILGNLFDLTVSRMP